MCLVTQHHRRYVDRRTLGYLIDVVVSRPHNDLFQVSGQGAPQCPEFLKHILSIHPPNSPPVVNSPVTNTAACYRLTYTLEIGVSIRSKFCEDHRCSAFRLRRKRIIAPKCRSERWRTPDLLLALVSAEFFRSINLRCDSEIAAYDA